MKYDLAIIGSGLAGLFAAKTAVEAGLNTVVLAKGLGIFPVLGYGIDLLGYYPSDSKKPLIDVRTALTDIVKANPQHPYARVGSESIWQALNSFRKLFSPGSYNYIGQEGENVILPTGIGTLRPTYMAPMTMIHGTNILSKKTLLIGFNELSSFSAIAAGLNLERINDGIAGINVRGQTVTVGDLTGMTDISPASLALLFEREDFRKHLLSKVDAVRKDETLIGFPSVLGLHKADEVATHLEQGLGSRVFEIAIPPPSIPGMRLIDLIQAHLRTRGVQIHFGFEIVAAQTKKDCCSSVILNAPTGLKHVNADAFILATGGLFSNGLREEKGRIIEPIFNIPVAQPANRENWFRDMFMDPAGHAINKAGLRTDQRLQPVDEKGRVFYKNLYVAGSILSGFDAMREKSGSGVDLVTGYQAARNIAE